MTFRFFEFYESIIAPQLLVKCLIRYSKHENKLKYDTESIGQAADIPNLLRARKVLKTIKRSFDGNSSKGFILRFKKRTINHDELVYIFIYIKKKSKISYP